MMICKGMNTIELNNWLEIATLETTLPLGYDIKLYLIETPVLEISECGVPLHFHYSQVHSDSQY